MMQITKHRNEPSNLQSLLSSTIYLLCLLVMLLCIPSFNVPGASCLAIILLYAVFIFLKQDKTPKLSGYYGRYIITCASGGSCVYNTQFE